MRFRLITLLSIILLFGFLTTNIVNYGISRNLVKQNILGNSLPLTRDNIYSEMQRDLMRPIYVSSLMANDTFLKDWVLAGEKDLESITRYLTEVKGKYNFFSAFFISERTGKYYHFRGLHKKVSKDDPHDIWYYNFKDLNVEYDLDVDTNEAEQNHLTIFINHRLTDYAGNFLGVVGVGLNFDLVASLLDEYKEKYNRNIYLVDPNGLIQVHTNNEHILKTNIYHQEGIREIAEMILETRDVPTFYEYNAKGQNIVLTCRYVKELNWYLLVEQNQSQALSTVKMTFIKNLLFSLFITLSTIMIALWIINYFQKQLELMAICDKLTGAYNRNGFENKYNYLEGMQRRGLVELSMILFDIDYLKRINDTCGHLHGDLVIRKIAEKAREVIRKNDLLVRWGGDEFIVLILGDLYQAKNIAQRLSLEIDGLNTFFADENGMGKQMPQVSISCGVAQKEMKDDLDAFIGKADTALYLAKERGRHTIVIHEES